MQHIHSSPSFSFLSFCPIFSSGSWSFRSPHSFSYHLPSSRRVWYVRYSKTKTTVEGDEQLRELVKNSQEPIAVTTIRITIGDFNQFYLYFTRVLSRSRSFFFLLRLIPNVYHGKYNGMKSQKDIYIHSIIFFIKKTKVAKSILYTNIALFPTPPSETSLSL